MEQPPDQIAVVRQLISRFRLTDDEIVMFDVHPASPEQIAVLKAAIARLEVLLQDMVDGRVGTERAPNQWNKPRHSSG